jgi:hypothetical protein
MHWMVCLLEDATIPDHMRLHLIKSLMLLIQSSYSRSPSSEEQTALEDRFAQSLKIAFRQAGGVTTLVNAIKSEQSSLELCGASFLMLAEILRDCEENQIYLGDQFGYCEFANLLRQTQLSLGPHLFGVVFEYDPFLPFSLLVVLSELFSLFLFSVFVPRVFLLSLSLPRPLSNGSVTFWIRSLLFPHFNRISRE